MPSHDPSASLSFSATIRFRVLDLVVDAGRQIVSRNGSELHVPKLSFDLLLALVRAAPNTVSVPELMERVWPRQVVGVETVAQRVKLLRRALGDEAAQPRYLTGERRRGYRIIAAVEALPAEGAVTAAAEEENAPARLTAMQPPDPVTIAERRRRRIPTALGIGIAVLLMAGLIDLVGRGTHPDARGSMSAPGPAAPYSVAVLPFHAISSGPDDAQLGRGISELVTNRLTREPTLSVIASDSALALRGEAESAVEAGRRLGVHYVVDGSVQREGSQVRVDAQLIDVSAGRHVGALLLERSTAELFHLEDDIAGRITYLLLGKVSPEDGSVQEFGAEATLAYLRARSLLATRKVADAQAAIEEFTRAIAIAPAFSSAYAGRAEARFQRLFVMNAFDENAAGLFAQMQPDIDRALQMDSGNAPALFIRAKLRDMKGDHDGAESDYQHAMAIGPGFAAGVGYYAEFMNSVRGNPRAALAVLDAGIPLNPMAARLIYLKALITSQASHDDAAAAALYLRTIQIAPDYWAAYNRLGSMRWSEGRLAEAIGFAEASVRIDPEVAWNRENLARMYIDLGDLAAARNVLAHFHEPSKHEGAALLCYRSGQLQAAVAWLHPALSSPYTDTGGPALGASITALLEQANRSGDYAAARAELLKMSWLTDDKGALDYSFANALPLLQLATLERQAGHTAAADHIATRLLAMRDDPTAQGNHAGDIERTHMLALALLGRDQEALAILDAQRSSAARELWWVWIERHPAMQRLRHDSRVQQLLTELRSWSRRERELVEAARRSGKLPVRTAEGTPDPCTPTVVASLQASRR
jgi:TolB-like protein/DNA-binding winged helix-turn-helix (wHTH) protein/tetratricopeptide (TPR) repeat protein